MLLTTRTCPSWRYILYEGSIRPEYTEVEEQLDMAGCVGLAELAGASILNSHRYWDIEDVVGVIESGVVEGDALVCRGRLSRREAVAGIAQDLADGILRNFSGGFDRIEETLTLREGLPPLVTVTTDAKFNATEAFISLMETSEDELGAMAADRYVAVAGRNAHSNLRIVKEVEQAAQNPLNVQMQSIDKRKGVRMCEGAVDLASYGRARYTLPDGTTDGFVSDEYMYLSPVGAGQARSIVGPSDMKEFWGNPLDMYASVEPLRHGKGEEVLLQRAILNLMARPRAVIKVKVIGRNSLKKYAALK